MPASTDDLRAGWEIYRNSGFQLSRDEINERLRTAGFEAVSSRAYVHYRRLERRGFRRYVTINRLDTMSVPDPFADESIRSRYSYANADVPTQLILHLQQAQFEVLGRADSLSDFGTEIVVSDPAQMEGLRSTPPPAHTVVSVNFLSPPATAYGFVDFVDVLDPTQVRIGIVFRQLMPVQELIGAKPLGTSGFRVVVGDDPSSESSLDIVSRDVYWLVQTIESARGVVNIVLDGLAGDAVRSTPPSVARLTVSSPLDALLKFNIAVFLVMERAFEKFGEYSEMVSGIARAVLDRPLTEAKADLTAAQAEHIRAQTEALHIENAQKAVVTEVLTATAEVLIPQIQAAGVVVNDDPQFDVERLLAVFNELRPGVDYFNSRGTAITAADDEEADS